MTKRSPQKILNCPACGSNRIAHLGSAPIYEGVVAIKGPSDLHRCFQCRLMFRHPYPSPSELVNIYSQLTADMWDYQKDRADFHLAAEEIQRWIPSGNVLDIGCFRGDFLSLLPENYKTYGVEPSHAAREVASAKGIKLVGLSFDQIASDSPGFDIITLLDVLEHLPRPFEALRIAVKHLKPGGKIILSTGNTDALPWRLLPNDYWYYVSEHVSFFCRHWFQWAGSKLGLEVARIVKFSHFNATLYRRLKQLVQCFVFRIRNSGGRYPQMLNPLMCVYPFSRVRKWDGAPITRHWKDHMLVILAFSPNHRHA